MVRVYLDTDCILALVKKSDWLKRSVKRRIKNEKNLCTSVVSVVECRLVLLRENSFEEAISVENVLKEYKIKLLPLDEKILKMSNDLMKEYSGFKTFDAIHASYVMLYKEKMLSSDTIFPSIDGVDVENPKPKRL